MNHKHLGSIVLAAATSSCAAMSGEPAHAAKDEASTVEQTRCGPGFEDAKLANVLSGEAIESVAPLYTSTPSSKSGEQERLYGATIRVRPVEGMTAEWLDRALECHSARRVLGRIPASVIPNDPFWLPGRMVDIEATSARDGFRVAVRGDTLDDAQEILIRANAFIAGKQRL